MKENEIARIVVDAAIEVHRTLGGPGLPAIGYNSLFEARALTYLRLCDLRLARVLNVSERQVRQGIHRVVNGLQE